MLIVKSKIFKITDSDDIVYIVACYDEHFHYQGKLFVGVPGIELLPPKSLIEISTEVPRTSG